MNHPELAQKLTAAQTALWPIVANTIGERCELMVQINSPLVMEADVDDLLLEFAAPSVIVQFAFAGDSKASQMLLLPLDTASALLTAVRGEPAEIDEDTLDTVRPPLEALVQGLCMGMGNLRSEVVVAADLTVRIGRFARPTDLPAGEDLIRVQLAFGVDATIGSLTWLLDPATAHYVANVQPTTSEPVTVPASAPFASIPPFGGSRSMQEPHGLDILMDIPLDISVELGRTRLVVKEVVDLGVGSIVEIDKAAGEPVDILVNGRLVAHGEVVVIEDNFGVRITEILNPRERIARLGEVA